MANQTAAFTARGGIQQALKVGGLGGLAMVIKSPWIAEARREEIMVAS